MNKPDCSEWNAWIGHEIEGSADAGEITLFIRNLRGKTISNVIERLGKKTTKVVNRVWFTKEFREWGNIHYAMTLFSKVCIESFLGEDIPEEIRKNARIYWRVPENFNVKKGDYLRIGEDYASEFHEVGTGVEVTPEMYQNDVWLM